MSNPGTIDEYIEAHSAGVSEFIYKSLETGVLVAIIQKILKIKGSRKGYQFESGRRASLKIRGVSEGQHAGKENRTVQ